ncbi:phospholipase D family protein [Mesobacillus jeotgali]|jgi:cardiolipin synthase A/B|uniref:phospholipase D n=1 Tax=Mesobacillus jeotgali TaxID=129985 RepID=A0ABY9VDJ0_9BACI|nr:phospholipase D family protein [Mesobacillus jeotgali]WNF20946.1 phospholipase D family protein [Mesobacillus jeotgali]
MRNGNNVFKRKPLLLFMILAIILVSTAVYQTKKDLPEGLSYEGEVHRVKDVRFLYDLTYKGLDGKQKYEHEIFDTIIKRIGEAEDFIVLDMFLFNGYYKEDMGYPEISESISEKLIAQKKKHKDLKVVFITDEINLTYGAHESGVLKELRDHDIEVIFTNLDPLRDSNPLYTAFWRVFLQWFGQSGEGWIPNPMAKNAPDVTLRSYFELLNLKANHRKVFATEKTAIVASANPHDASGFHSNIAFETSGNIIGDILESEQAVVNFSGGGNLPEYTPKKSEGDIEVQILTEGKILKHLQNELENTGKGDQIWIGMFYLAERKVIDEIDKAADRGAKINIILDPNTNAFGNQKSGLPNIPVSEEIMKLGSENINIKWYNAGQEQYHTKMIYFDRGKNSVILGGSANFTRRNLDDLNLETNMKIKADSDRQVIKDVDQYFSRIWNNDGAEYTLNYEDNKDKMTPFKYIIYWIQRILWFTSY